MQYTRWTTMQYTADREISALTVYVDTGSGEPPVTVTNVGEQDPDERLTLTITEAEILRDILTDIIDGYQ